MDAPAAATDLADLTATDLLALYRSGQASPVEATRAVLERIERVNPKTNAFALVAADDALASARASEARWQRGKPCGPLDGVPASIKDLVLTRGWPTLRGSHTQAVNQPWDVDAPTASSGEASTIAGGTALFSNPNWSPKGDFLTVEYENPVQPPDLFRIDLESKRMKQLTFSNLPGLENLKMAVPQQVSYKSFDGLEIPAFLYRPEKPNGAAVV